MVWIGWRYGVDVDRLKVVSREVVTCMQGVIKTRDTVWSDED